MGIVFGCIVPHPPIIVPDIGRGREVATLNTINALKELSHHLKESRPQSLMVISPHGKYFYDALGILLAPSCSGDLAVWGSRSPRLSFATDGELVSAIQDEAKAQNIPIRSIGEKSYELDHGVMVPFYYLREAVEGLPLVVISFCWLPLQTHFLFGKTLKRAAEAVGKRVAIIASGDLSHRLTPEAPAGYSPEGKEFDRKLIEALARWDRETILELDPEFVEKAGECGLRSIVILLGALEGLKAKPRVLSYEGPFGVGYLVASIKIDEEGLSPFVRLAKEAVETYVLERKVIEPPKELPEEMKKRAGVFVSLKKFGELRGCIGTYEPTKENIAQEIIANAISSASRDPRFLPITKDELPYLSYSVDILSPPAPVSDIKELDPKKYGVIVESGFRRGLLLPDLEGVDTVEQQIEICRRKAGIGKEEPIKIRRFTVKRYK